MGEKSHFSDFGKLKFSEVVFLSFLKIARAVSIYLQYETKKLIKYPDIQISNASVS